LDNSIGTPGMGLATQQQLTPAIWQMIKEIADPMYKSRLFGCTSADAAAAVMLKGYELGLGITASFELVQIVQGKPGLSPRGALALLHNSPMIKEIKITRLTGKDGAFIGYECAMTRTNGFSYTAHYYMEDAQRAGLIKTGSGWANYPENMCLWRAVGFAADVVAPDLTAGMTAIMKMPEQLGVGLSEGGDVIEGEWSAAPRPTEQPQPVTAAAPTVPAIEYPLPTVTGITLFDLLETYSAEAVMVANEGRVPATDGELAAVAKKLSGGV
jgi:hypothetical protein